MSAGLNVGSLCTCGGIGYWSSQCLTQPRPSRTGAGTPRSAARRCAQSRAPRARGRSSPGSAIWSIGTGWSWWRSRAAEGLAPEDAFDAVQDAFQTFLTLPAARPLVDEDDDSRRVLITLVRNEARNRRRLHAVARPHDGDAGRLAELPADAPSVEDLVAAAEQSAAARLRAGAGRGPAGGGHAAHAGRRRGRRRGAPLG